MRVSLTQSAIELLLNVLQDEDWRLRNTAVNALGNQLTLPESTLQALIGALQDENWSVRYSAAKALENQLTLPESTLQALIGALQDEDGSALTGALQDEDRDVRRLSAYALRKQPTLPESTLQALIGALQDEDGSVRSSAARALRNQSTMPASTLQALIGALQYNNENFQGLFVAVLEQHVESAFMTILSLSPSAMETLYRALLINFGSKHSASLWVQGHQGLFHSVQGPKKIDGLCVEDVKKVVKAFDLARKGASLPLIEE
ncbi:hypothetical protein BGX26_003226 [Mortierella sp. AD094]|nr:hypothetical protein BGX26_003226 [Mortierella sp. AD094]